MLRQLYSRIFSIDPRGLAAYRILTGMLMSLDGILRLRNLEVFYLESGAVPVSVAQQTANPNGPVFSLFFLSASDGFAVLLFLLYILLGVAVAIGYRSRISVVAAFLFAVSFDVRNPFVTSYADTLYRHLLFWAMFLPTGKRWSLDAARGRTPGPSFEPASAWMLLQIISMYFISAAYKLPEESWRTGREVALIMGRDSMAWLLGQHLTQFPALLKAGGVTWVALTITAPLVLVLPKAVRNLHILLLISCNLLLASTVRIGAFPLVSISGLLLFMSTGFWNRIESVLRPGRYVLRPGSLPDAVGKSKRYLVVCGVVVLLGLNSADASLWNHEVLGDRAEVKQQSGYATPDISGAKAVFYLNEPSWKVFSGEDYGTDIYPVALATAVDGEIENPLVRNHTSFQRPSKGLNGVYRTYRHRFFFIMNAQSPAMRHYMDYLCGENRYTYVSFFRVKERFNITQIDKPLARSRERSLISSYNCRSDRLKASLDPAGWGELEEFPKGSKSQAIVARRQN